MNESKIALQAIRLKGYIGSDRKLEILEEPIELPEGEVEVIVFYPQTQSFKKIERPSPLTWPTLDGGRYLGGTLRREEIYNNDGR
ncbi:hypothetical protein FJZ31_23655 [Candidatus Poribacteria bacterium]|nr:hypothetical protein [Candidatus Poribacteria bacterium]